MAGGYLAIGSGMSSLTRNQVVAFILSVVVCFAFLLSGLPMVTDLFSGWAPQVLESVNKQSSHTALSDVHDSIAELRHYRRHLAALALPGES